MVEPDTKLGTVMGEFTTSAQKGARRPSPSGMQIWGANTTRGVQHAVKKRHPVSGERVVYGLTAEGRRMLRDAQFEQAWGLLGSWVVRVEEITQTLKHSIAQLSRPGCRGGRHSNTQWLNWAVCEPPVHTTCLVERLSV